MLVIRNSRQSGSGGVGVSNELENLLWASVNLFYVHFAIHGALNLTLLCYGGQLSLKGHSTTSGPMLQS